MPAFAYTARDSATTRRGVEDAPTAAALVAQLRARGWLVTDVRPAPGDGASLNPFDLLPVRSLDVELSLQQLAVMVRSGLTLLTALRTVAEQARRRTMRRVWTEVADAIQAGSTLTDALAKHRCFPRMTLQLVKVGEQTGTLEPVLVRAAAALERKRAVRTHLLTALTYPAIVCLSAVGVAAFMVFSVIPKLQTLLASLGRRLPPVTQALLDVSAFAQNRLPYIVGALFALTVTLTALYLTPRGRLAMDSVALRLPVLGHLFRLAATTQFAFALGTLLRSGVTLVEALATVADLHANRRAGETVRAARDAVIRGGTLADQLTPRGVYLPMLPRMVAVGETAGTLDDVLDEVAKFHEAQLQGAIRRLSVLIEPAVVVVVGGIVGFVYIAFFMALFSVAGGSPR